jgi:hypothetical protein
MLIQLFLALYGTQRLMQYSQYPASGSYPEPDLTTLYIHILLIQVSPNTRM